MASINPISKSKKKRLNRKAKILKFHSQLSEEQKGRHVAESNLSLWKEKAHQYRRKYNESEMMRLVPARTRKPIPSQRKQIPSVQSSSKATPSNRQAQSCPYVIQDIPLYSLSIPEVHCELGSGKFGECIHMIYKDMFNVCVKQLSSDISLPTIKLEAGIMQELSCQHIPHCFGVCTSKRAIVMALVTISGRPVTLYAALSDLNTISISNGMALQFINDVASGLKHIHSKCFLHNDLKLDNIVLGESLSKPVRVYIIDFGKACKISEGKQYHLCEGQKKVYQKDHTQIAPDLRDGIVKQSIPTDIYSFGRVIKRVNRVLIHSDKLEEVSKKSLSYCSTDRPNLSEILQSLQDLTIVNKL